ncbi:hypothetical protein FOL47_001028 [Perkinsus chesapeaki]|uniref:Uncharacterized protein n=1 Tax=Perkinsus chesapeaki TaxID=330153 RepID=A0A7J6MKW7_PERCH|nr:hypothetical protein FOL47_001028 [Perkinsus chesapeaki]
MSSPTIEASQTPPLPAGTPEGTPTFAAMLAELATLRQQNEAIKDELKDKNEELRTLRGFVNEARRKPRTPAKLNRRGGDALNTRKVGWGRVVNVQTTAQYLCTDPSLLETLLFGESHSTGNCLGDTPGRCLGMPSPPAELRAIAPTPIALRHPDTSSVGVNTSPPAKASSPPPPVPSPPSSAKGSPPVTPKGIPPLPLGKLGLAAKAPVGPKSAKGLPPAPPKTSPILTCPPPKSSPTSAKGSPPPTFMNLAAGKATPPPLPGGKAIPPLPGPKGPPPRIPLNLGGPKALPKARQPNPYVSLHIKGVDINKAKGKRATACSVSTPRGGAGSTDSGTDTPMSCDSSVIQAAQLEHAHDEPLLQYFTKYGSRPRDLTPSECGTPRSCASDADTSGIVLPAHGDISVCSDGGPQHSLVMSGPPPPPSMSKNCSVPALGVSCAERTPGMSGSQSTKSLLPVMPSDCVISRQVGADKIWKRVDSKFLMKLFKKKEVMRDLNQKGPATGKELENPLGTPSKPLTVFGTKEHRLVGIVAQKVFMQMEPPPSGVKIKSRSEHYRNLLLRCDESVWQADQLGPVESLLRDLPPDVTQAVIDAVDHDPPGACRDEVDLFVYYLRKIPDVRHRLQLMIFLSGFEEEFRAIEVNLTTMYRALEVMYELLDKFALVLQVCVKFANALNPGGRQIEMFQLGAFSKFYELKCTENPRISCLHCVIALMSEDDVKALLDRVVTRCIERAAELRAYRTVDDVHELTDSFHDIEHALEREREREKKRRLTSVMAQPPGQDWEEKDDSEPLDTFHTHLAHFYREKIAASQWLFDYGLNVYASYRNLCMTFVDYDSVWPPPKERGPESKDLFEVCHDMLKLIAKVEQDIQKLKLREQFSEQYPVPAGVEASVERGNLSSPVCVTPPMPPSTPSTVVSDSIAAKSLVLNPGIGRPPIFNREKENVNSNVPLSEPERTPTAMADSVPLGGPGQTPGFPSFSHLNSPPPSPPSEEGEPTDTPIVSTFTVSDPLPSPPAIPPLSLVSATEVADAAVPVDVLLPRPSTDSDMELHPVHQIRGVFRERPRSIVIQSESLDGSSMSELDQSTLSVSSAHSTRSVKSSRGGKVAAPSAEDTCVLERRSRVSRKRSMRSIVSMVSGAQDFRPPPVSSNSGANKRNVSRHGSESREAERLRRRLESRKSMTNSVARILKRKNPQLEESILPDSEDEEFASGRCAGIYLCRFEMVFVSLASFIIRLLRQSSVSSTGSSRPDIPPLSLSVSRGTAALKKPATVLGQESPRLFEHGRANMVVGSDEGDGLASSTSSGGSSNPRWSTHGAAAAAAPSQFGRQRVPPVIGSGGVLPVYHSHRRTLVGSSRSGRHSTSASGTRPTSLGGSSSNHHHHGGLMSDVQNAAKQRLKSQMMEQRITGVAPKFTPRVNSKANAELRNQLSTISEATQEQQQQNTPMFEALIDAITSCGVLGCIRKPTVQKNRPGQPPAPVSRRQSRPKKHYGSIGTSAGTTTTTSARSGRSHESRPRMPMGASSSSGGARYIVKCPNPEDKNDRWYRCLILAAVISSKIIHRHISQDYRLESAIGSGFSGSVVIGYHRTSGLKYAIKQLDKRRLADKGVLNLAAHEASVLLSTDHPSVCKLHAVYETGSKLWLVMEYIQGKDLCEWLAARRRSLKRSEARIVLTQVIDALAYLHRMNIMHRDVKLEHFIIDSNNCLKLIDFGFATRSHGELRSRVCGTYPYVAPEVFRGDAGCASDMWSAGIIALLMTTGPRHRNVHNILSQKKGSTESHKSYEMNGRTLELLLKADPTILTCPGDIPANSRSSNGDGCNNECGIAETTSASACYCPVFASFILSLLNADPSKRMTAEQARRHPWLLGQCCEDDRLTSIEPLQPLPRGHGTDTTSNDRLKDEALACGEAAREVLESRYYMGLPRTSKLVLQVLAALDCDNRKDSPRRRAELAYRYIDSELRFASHSEQGDVEVYPRYESFYGKVLPHMLVTSSSKDIHILRPLYKEVAACVQRIGSGTGLLAQRTSASQFTVCDVEAVVTSCCAAYSATLAKPRLPVMGLLQSFTKMADSSDFESSTTAGTPSLRSRSSLKSIFTPAHVQTARPSIQRKATVTFSPEVLFIEPDERVTPPAVTRILGLSSD